MRGRNENFIAAKQMCHGDGVAWTDKYVPKPGHG